MKRKKMNYTKAEEAFYKRNKRKIIDGLKNDVPKNQIKRIFFSNVREEQEVNHVSKHEAMKKVLRSRTFTSKEENYELYKEEVLKKVFKGQTREVKKYLKTGRMKFADIKWKYTDEGWVARGKDGTYVQLIRNADTKTEGYQIIYGQDSLGMLLQNYGKEFL